MEELKELLNYREYYLLIRKHNPAIRVLPLSTRNLHSSHSMKTQRVWWSWECRYCGDFSYHWAVSAAQAADEGREHFKSRHHHE